MAYTAFLQLLMDPPGVVFVLLPGMAAALILSKTHVSDLLLIDYCAYRSRLRSLDGLSKLTFFLLCLVLAVASSSRLFHLSLFLLQVVLSVGVGGVPLKRYLRFLEAPVMFLLMGALGIMVQISFSPLSISMTSDSLIQARQVSWRAFSALSCLYSLSLSTPMNQLLETLRRLKIPEMMIEVMLSLYRYVFVLFTLYYPMKRALELRRGNGIRGLGLLWSSLFRRSYLRAEMSYLSMNARGYSGAIRFLSSPTEKRKGMLALLAGSVFVIVGAWLL